MNIEAYERREKLLLLSEQLVAAEEDRLLGKKGYSIDELDDMFDRAIISDIPTRRHSRQTKSSLSPNIS